MSSQLRFIESRSLCWLLSALMLLGPAGPALQAAEAVEGGVDASYVAPNSVGAVLLRPRQILQSEIAQVWPVEVLSAASVKEIGFDILDVESVLITLAPPFNERPEFSVSFELSAELDLDKIPSPKFHEQAERVSIGGKSYLKSKTPGEPSIYQPRPNRLVIASDKTMQRFLQEDYKPLRRGQVHEWLEQQPHDDLALLVDLQALRPLIQIGMAAAAMEVPAEYQKFLDLPSLLGRAEARLSISGAGPIELVAEANDGADADRIEELIEEALKLYDAQVAATAAQMLASDDPVEQAMGRYQLRVAPQFAEEVRPNRDGKRFEIFSAEPAAEGSQAQLAMIATSGVLVALLLPAVQAAREAARRTQSMNNMKQIMLALLNHEATHAGFPAHASYSEDGRPLLSWRVHILPFLDQIELYRRFRLDEPWDSPHNKKLIPLMPEVYLDPSSALEESAGRTHYLGVLGKGSFFDGTKTGTALPMITDGTSNTVAVLQVSDARAATWTRPDDWSFNPNKPLDGLDGPHPGVFLAGFVDGHVEAVSLEVDAELLRAYTTKSGGEGIPRP